MAQGKYDQAMKLLQNNRPMLKNIPDLFIQFSQVRFCQGDFNAAQKEIAEALSLEPGNMDYLIQQGNIEQISGNIPTAEKTYSRLLEQNDPFYVGEAHFWLGLLYGQEGRFSRSENEVKTGIKVMQNAGLKENELELMLWLIYLYLQKPDLHQAGKYIQKIFAREDELAQYNILDKALHLSGLYLCLKKELTGAEKIAERLQQMGKANNDRLTLRYYFSLAGAIEQQKGRYEEARKKFANIFPLLASQKSQEDEHALFMTEMAGTCFKNKDWQEAQKHYEAITQLTTGRLYFGDIYARSYYWLGRTYQELKLDARARECYEKFLNIWKEADASLPELADARRRLGLIEKKKTF
jgi:tetratricopeptide (TPR) repeat protein